MNFNDARLLIQGAFSRVISIMVFAVYFMDCLAWWARQYIYIDTTISYSPFPYVYTLTYYRSLASCSEIHKHKLGYTQIYWRNLIGWNIPTFETFFCLFFVGSLRKNDTFPKKLSFSYDCQLVLASSIQRIHSLLIPVADLHFRRGSPSVQFSSLSCRFQEKLTK